MSGEPLPGTPTAADFRALAASSPWRFTTVHFTHRQQEDSRRTPVGGPVEAWLDRRTGRVTVRSSAGVEVVEGAPYSGSVCPVGRDDEDAVPSPRDAGVVLRPDGLIDQRPDGWHFDHGDPMWRDYQWTAMLDPAELSRGVDVRDVTATTLRGRLTWAATCRPLLGDHDAWDSGYDPRCGCCPLLDSPASRILEYGPQDPILASGDLPTVYCVRLDAQTGIVVDVTPLDGIGGSSFTNELHAVDAPLNPPP